MNIGVADDQSKKISTDDWAWQMKLRTQRTRSGMHEVERATTWSPTQEAESAVYELIYVGTSSSPIGQAMDCRGGRRQVDRVACNGVGLYAAIAYPPPGCPLDCRRSWREDWASTVESMTRPI